MTKSVTIQLDCDPDFDDVEQYNLELMGAVNGVRYHKSLSALAKIIIECDSPKSKAKNKQYSPETIAAMRELQTKLMPYLFEFLGKGDK